MRLLLLLLALVGCDLVEGRDYWIDHPSRTIYARSAQVAESICLQRGADTATYRARNFARGWDSAPSYGCYDSRDDVIVCERGNPVCVAHEQAHRGGWHHD